jgi:hypothetical protein
MSATTKTCPACGADLSAGTAAMPGVCPACGRDLRLEEIVAKLARTPEDSPSRKSPMGLVECAECSVASLALCMVGGLFLRMSSGIDLLVFLISIFLVAPNFFFGFMVAGFWSRTKPVQFFFGFLLGVGLLAASMAVLYLWCRLRGIAFAL